MNDQGETVTLQRGNHLNQVIKVSITPGGKHVPPDGLELGTALLFCGISTAHNKI